MQSLCSRDKFSILYFGGKISYNKSQSLCSRDKFSIGRIDIHRVSDESQSLCSRDKFSMGGKIHIDYTFGRNPFEAGTSFQFAVMFGFGKRQLSQSL